MAEKRTYRLTGDICRPGVVEVFCTEAELCTMLDEHMLTFDKHGIELYDEQAGIKIAGFIADGTVQDIEGNDIELPDASTEEPDASTELCPHGNPLGDCTPCDVAGDLAYDADRERRP